MALIGSAFGLGVVLGPGLGAALAQFGLLVPVYVSAAVALLNGLFVALRVPEPERREHLREFAPSAAVLVRVWPVLGVGFVVTLACVAMEQTVAFLFQDVLSLSTEEAARAVGIALVAYGIAAVLAQGFFARRAGATPLRLVLWGVPLTALGFVGLVVTKEFGTLSAALAVQGLGQGLVMPGIAAALSLSVGDGEQGEVAGLNSASQALSRTLGPVAGTSLWSQAPAALRVCGRGARDGVPSRRGKPCAPKAGRRGDGGLIHRTRYKSFRLVTASTCHPPHSGFSWRVEIQVQPFIRWRTRGIHAVQ